MTVLALLTGPVRSGKSRLALELAERSAHPTVLAVAGIADDPEMARRIEHHRAERDAGIVVVEIADPERWLDAVPEDACLVLDCLGTLVARLMGTAMPDDAELANETFEELLAVKVDDLIGALSARGGDTVVVTNEVGWGVVPTHPSGRAFRDALGRANARLVARADVAWLVVAGRAIDLKTASGEVQWPH